MPEWQMYRLPSMALEDSDLKRSIPVVLKNKEENFGGEHLIED